MLSSSLYCFVFEFSNTGILMPARVQSGINCTCRVKSIEDTIQRGCERSSGSWPAYVNPEFSTSGWLPEHDSQISAPCRVPEYMMHAGKSVLLYRPPHLSLEVTLCCIIPFLLTDQGDDNESETLVDR